MSLERHQKTSTTRPKVFVGLSGGVDSATSAYLLVQEGYDVTGVFIKVWQPPWWPCSAARDRLDAMRVCAHLGIPFQTLDLTEEYRRGVVGYLVKEYREGQTPNPDVMCNREIKFGAFLKFALAHGADFVATGHYAQNILAADGRYELRVSRDRAKDQTYFLWTLMQDQLQHILFPVGDMEKSAVRALARTAKLPVSDKKDSQGLCFLGPVDIKEFLGKFVLPQRGEVLNTAGEVVGEHDGAHLYTLGERHGFVVSADKNSQTPQYIVAKDISRNTLTVAEEAVPLKNARAIALKDVRWIGGASPHGQNLSARIRYRGELRPVHLLSRNGRLSAVFHHPQLVSPGQSVVFYRGNMCLGGAVVASTQLAVLSSQLSAILAT